jgi:DNA-binding NtrC family response regulator
MTVAWPARMIAPPSEVGAFMAQRLAETATTRLDEVPDEPLEVIFIGEDPSLAELYKLKLELDGYRVTVAPTGAHELNGARRRMPDIVFVDVGATEQSMLAAIGKLRRNRGLNEVPTVLLWAGAGTPLAVDDLHLGAKSFLVKPIRVPTADRWADLLGRPVRSRDVH